MKADTCAILLTTLFPSTTSMKISVKPMERGSMKLLAGLFLWSAGRVLREAINELRNSRASIPNARSASDQNK
ncbi:MAG: hypothetical protein ACT4P8_02030 [Betaproteobacteria bacterium]